MASDVEEYIRHAAIARGINPDVAVAVANSEGMRDYVGDQGSSFGPYQLHYGGVARGGNSVSGLGDEFTKATGLDARDPKTWQSQVDFALDHARSGGWGPWHGWKGNPQAGIGKGNQMADDFLTDFDVAPPKENVESKGKDAIKAAPSDASSGKAERIYVSPSKADVSDFESDFEVAPSKEKTASTVQDSERPIGANDAVRSVATGVPIIGGLLNRADAATDAGLSYLLNPLFAEKDQLKGSLSERYHQALAQQEGLDTSFAAQHPTANTALNVIGGVAGTVPAMMAAPALFGLGEGGLLANSALSGVTGAGIGAADSAIRSAGNLDDIKSGAMSGGVFGALAPGAGKAVGMGIGKLADLVAHTTPAARNVANILEDIGMTPKQAETALTRMGPQATLADLDPALTTEAGGLASMGGKPTSVLKNAMLERAAQSDERMGQMVDQYLGPKPDTDAILGDIRDREGDLAYDSKIARSSLDQIMGKSTDPYQVLQQNMKQRSEAAAPLYKKALSHPVQWDERLQQFLDDPIVKSGIAKGVRIQRLEALAEGKSFNPNDYAIKGFNEAGDPIIDKTPNMLTLSVVKEGLDAMVEDAKDPVTGRLSKEGRAIDKVRGAFLQKLDDINPDYKAARQAWAGPSQTQDAYNRGLNVFQNRSGSSGVNSTPEALASWFKTASDGEKEVAKIGARAAFEQQMQSAGDAASRATALVNKEANQAKLTALFGKDQADKLTRQLNFKYEDPVGQAFDRGLNVFKSREGRVGIEDTPAHWGKMLQSASPGELEAYRQGARQAIEQALTAARQGDVSAARSLFAKSTANRQKLEMLFPEAKRLFEGLNNELQMRSTEQRVAQNSATAERRAVQEKYAPKAEHPIDAATPILGEALYGGPGAAGLTALKMAYGGARRSLSANALNKLTEGTAKGLIARGAEQREFLRQVERAARTNSSSNALVRRGVAAANLLTRSGRLFVTPYNQNNNQ